MHRVGMNTVVDCAECEAPVDVGRERCYRGEGNWALCWGCAIARGGQFDENEGRWTRLPDVIGLTPQDEHRVR